MARKLYSYQRWSSAVQKEGTTQQRQSNAAKKYAEEHGYDLVEIRDDGVSAFKSVNAKRGALSAFIRAVEDGYIEANSLLYVESLDRISRDKVLKALGLFNDLLELRIAIVTGVNNKVYTAESINENSMDLIETILEFVRGHAESVIKQIRVNGNAETLIKRFQDGHPTTIKSVGSHPWWIDSSTKPHEAVRKHPALWPAAQFAINLFLEGHSVFKVTQLLNEKYHHLYKGKAWSYANVRKLRINPAVYGMRELSVNGQSYKLSGYYPPLITEGQYLRLEQIRETTKYLGKVGEQTNNINLLAGMKLFRCGHCGGTMMAMRHGDTIRYLCEKGRGYAHDCKTWSLPGILVEHTLMLVTTIAYMDIQRKGKVSSEDYTQQITNTENLIAEIGTRISRATSLVLAGLGNVDEVVTQIKDLEQHRKDLISELELLQRRQILSKDKTFESLMMDFFTYAQYGVLQDPIHEYRNKLRDIVRSSISDVRAWKENRRLYISFQIKGYDEYFNFSAGKTPYEWGCHFGNIPFIDNSKAFATSSILTEKKMKEVKAKFEAYELASMNMLKHAQDLLETVNYPELDSKLFWPRK